LSKHPNHSYEASPETLLVLAWCSTLDLRALLEKDQRERSWHYPHLHDRHRDWLPVYPAELLSAPIKEALACFDDDPYGPALRILVEYRLQLVDIDMVVHAIGLQGLADPAHSLFYSDELYEDYTVRQQRANGPMRKVTIASLEEKYKDLYYTDAVYEAPGNAGYEVRRPVSSIRSRLRDIRNWAHDDRRLARQKREEAINEFRTWDCLPRRYRDREWLAWIKQTDLMQFVEIIKERGELLKVNRVAKQAAADIEASNKTRYS